MLLTNALNQFSAFFCVYQNITIFYMEIEQKSAEIWFEDFNTSYNKAKIESNTF